MLNGRPLAVAGRAPRPPPQHFANWQQTLCLLLLRFSPLDMNKFSLDGLLSAFEIWPSFETVAPDKTSFMGVQETPIGCERYKFQMVLKDDSANRGLISWAVLNAQRLNG
jgi:hypothetical protein